MPKRYVFRDRLKESKESRLAKIGWEVIPQPRTGSRETPLAKFVVCSWHNQLTMSIRISIIRVSSSGERERERGRGGRARAIKYQKDRASARTNRREQSSRSHAVATRRGRCSCYWLLMRFIIVGRGRRSVFFTRVESVRHKHLYTNQILFEPRWITGSGRDHLGHCAPSGYRISLTIPQLLTGGSRK